VDAAVELQKRRGRDQEPGAEGAFIRSCVLGFGRGAYEDGAAFEGHVDAGAADLAAGAQRRDHHPVPLADATPGGRPLRCAARRRGDGRHVSAWFQRREGRRGETGCGGALLGLGLWTRWVVQRKGAQQLGLAHLSDFKFKFLSFFLKMASSLLQTMMKTEFK
jgi:hypothetical protein